MSYNNDPKTWRWAPCNDHRNNPDKRLPCMEVRDEEGRGVPTHVVFETLRALLHEPAGEVELLDGSYKDWAFVQGGWPQHTKTGNIVSAAGVLKGFHDVSDELRKVRKVLHPLYGAVGFPHSDDEDEDEAGLVRETLDLLERYHDLAKGVKKDDEVAADIASQVVQVVRKDFEVLVDMLRGSAPKKRSVLEDENLKLRKDVAARDELIESLTRSRQLDMESIREFLKLETPPPAPPEEPTHAQLDEQDKRAPQCKGCDDCAPRHADCNHKVPGGGDGLLDDVDTPCRFRWVEKTETTSAFWRTDCGFVVSVEDMRQQSRARRQMAENLRQQAKVLNARAREVERGG